VCLGLCPLSLVTCVCRLFFIDKIGEEMTEQEKQRLDQRAQRFSAAESNRTFKKKLSVAELVQAVVSDW